MVAFEKMLAKCGDCHCMQYIMLLFFCLINVLSSMHYYSQTIISFVPKYWCSDGIEIINNSAIITRSSVVPPSSSSCDRIRYTDTANGSSALWQSPAADNATRCNHYSYELYMGYHSFTSDMNWICDDGWKLTLGQSMFFVGSVVGSLIFGIVADIIGRVPVLIIANLTAMIGNTMTIFSSNLVLFSLFRFTSGLATDSNFVMMYILVMEYLRPTLRTFGLCICIGFFYCIGSMAAPWIAILTGSWRSFLIVSSLPLAIVPVTYFVVPESVQWLVSKQKYEKAVVCLRRVANTNGKHVDEQLYGDFVEECKHSQQHMTKASGASLLDLFRTRRLRRNTLILLFKSMVITLSYDAVSRNVQGLGISPFVMFTLSATTILPACLLLILLQDKIGRKAMASMSLLLSGIFTSITGGLLFNVQSANNSQHVVFIVTLSIIGRFGVTVAYNSGSQYATELIPTCVRGQGVALVHVVGYAFTFLSSYILHTRTWFNAMPEIILGLLSLLGAGLCLFLPETLNRTLPSSLKDGENFGKNDHWYSFSFLEKRSQSEDVLAGSDRQSARSSRDYTGYF